MDAKASHTTWWNIVLSLPWMQQKRWIPMGSKGWPHMQFDKPRANEWGRPNLVHTMDEKPFKAKKIKIKDLTRIQPSSHFRPCTRFQMCAMWIQMQIKKDARKRINMQTFLNAFMKPIYAFFYKLFNMGYTWCYHHTKKLLHQPQVGLEWDKPKLFALITFNMNRWESTKNLDTMTRATSTQLPR
jgi:hypothetical protein